MFPASATVGPDPVGRDSVEPASMCKHGKTPDVNFIPPLFPLSGMIPPPSFCHQTGLAEW
jgi:hypothetical protein